MNWSGAVVLVGLVVPLEVKLPSGVTTDESTSNTNSNIPIAMTVQ